MTAAHHHAHEAEHEDAAGGVAREGVDRSDDARADQESAEQAEREGQDREQDADDADHDEDLDEREPAQKHSDPRSPQARIAAEREACRAGRVSSPAAALETVTNASGVLSTDDRCKCGSLT